MDLNAEPIGLGHNAVAVAIDKGKNSQQAVRWTIDHFLKGKDYQVVLIHVKTHHYHPQMEISTTSIAPSDSDVQQLFLPYRGFCSRKGIDAMEVVLHDIDVASALISYIDNNNLGTIVVGASNRNAITRRFKSADVPSSLEKSAPDFCAVYVIYKGKVQSMRGSNVCLIPSALTRPNAGAAGAASVSQSSVSSASSYRTSDYKTSLGHSSISSGTSRSSLSHSERYYFSDNSNPRISVGSESVSSHVSRDGHYVNPRPIRTSGRVPDRNSQYNNPRLRYDCDSPRDHFPYYSRSSDNSSNTSSSRYQVLGQPPIHPFSNAEYTSRNSNSYSSSNESQVSPEGYNQGQVPSQSSSNSFETASSVKSSSSSQSNSFSDELDAEMRKLKLEIRNTMELYHSICEQANAAKQQADYIQSGEEDDIEDIKLAKEAVMVVADLERLKCQAAMDAAQLTERFAELEGSKRKLAEQNAARQEEEERRLGNRSSPVSYRLYSLKEIEVGTNYFSSSLKIGEGGYGPVYKATLQHTPVAIKVLRPNVSQGLKQFQQEIEILGRMRHPNMVLLVGACPEYGCLVYEYMDNGSLEDRLFCVNNTPPIPCKTRFKIAAEIATSLCFLHEAKPEPLVHRDLKPANILLDSNYTSKIGDVGLARLVPPTVANQMTQYHMTAAAGTFCYIDPEYQQTGQLGTKSDIYSLGIILLQLITARNPMALSYHVEGAIDGGKFEDVLDPSIPGWPIHETLSLAELALKCCQLRKKDRPDLTSVILPELTRIRDLVMSS